MSVIREIDNSRLLESWLTARLAKDDGGMIVYRFKCVSDTDSDHVPRTGLAAFDQEVILTKLPYLLRTLTIH